MTTTDRLAIDLHDVAKTYRRRVQALRGIDMQVHQGEVFGLLGANGAGKSTLVKIMMTIVRATRAKGTVLGQPIGHKPSLAHIGYLPEHHRFPPYLKAVEALAYYAALAKVPRADRRRRIEQLMELVGMADYATAKMGTYSKGMMQRIGLAQALLNAPALLVLDEPTDGVDPIGRREIRNVLIELKRQGKTVFLNSHLLGEVEMICDRVAILHQGVLVKQGRISDLTQNSQYYEIALQVDQSAAAAAIQKAINFVPTPGARGFSLPRAGTLPSPGLLVGQLSDGRRVELDGDCIRLAADDASDVQDIIDALRRASLTIRAVQPVRQSLEDYFMQTVQALKPPDAQRPGAAPPPIPPQNATPAVTPVEGGRP